MIFNNIQLLGYNHQNSFLGEKSFYYSIVKQISIRGYILDLLNDNGVKNVFEGVQEIKSLARNFQEVTINGVSFGKGKIKSLSFDEGNWVKNTEFQAEIEILDEVSITDLGPEFNGVNLNNKNLHLIKNFNETFTLDFDADSSILGGDHNIQIEFESNDVNLNLISFAQQLALELLKTLPSNLKEGNYNTRPENSYSVLKSESYDLINSSCGFSKKFSYQNNNNLDKPFSINRNISIRLDSEGRVAVKEDASIKAESNSPSLYECALLGLNDPVEGINNSFNRCNLVFNRYKTSNRFNIENSELISSGPSQKSIVINKFDGTINYSVEYDNDEKRKNANFIFENTLIIQRDADWIWKVIENGTIEGVGVKYNLVQNDKYKKAENAWNTKKNEITNNTLSIWNTYVSSADKASSSLKLVNKNVVKKPAEGQITYSYEYSDDPRINLNSDIRRINIEYSKTDALSFTKEFIIPNRSYTFIQNQGFTKQGSATLSASAEIALLSQNQIFNGFQYINALKQRLSSFVSQIPSSQKYIEEVSFNSNEIEQTASYSITYKHS
jgi:hypothetical protein